jgi:hypothetical protein
VSLTRIRFEAVDGMFAGRTDLLEALLGGPIEQARREFLEFASVLAEGNADTRSCELHSITLICKGV